MIIFYLLGFSKKYILGSIVYFFLFVQKSFLTSTTRIPLYTFLVGPQVYLLGSLVITLVVRVSVCPCVCLLLNISETAHSFFLKLCMKLQVSKVKKVTRRKFWRKKLNLKIKGDWVSKILVFWHFLVDRSLKLPNFLHGGRRQ